MKVTRFLRTAGLAAIWACVAAIGCQRTTPAPAPAGSTAGAAIHVAGFAAAEQAVQQAIDAGEIPGAVLLAGVDDRVVYRKALGCRAIEPASEPMTEDTIFDLASLTKCVATAASIMKLVDQGRIEVHAPAARYVPEFGAAGKESITVEQLLIHRAGLIADNPLSDYARGGEEAWAKICHARPAYPPGTRFVYSDVGYIVLGRIVQAVSGLTLDEYARREIFQPLGMARTQYRPPSELWPWCAPTEYQHNDFLRGKVHDPRAQAMGGVAGHAGLFATADDLARFCRMIVNRGELDGVRVLSPAAVARMTTPHAFPDGSNARTYGFDVDTSYSSARGHRFAPGSTFGHTGFTGTLLWIDPPNRCYAILLTNRLHPAGKGSVTALRRVVMTRLAEAMLGPGGVLNGVDVLERDEFAELRGRNVGLVTNHTGLNRIGRRTIDLIARAPEVRLVALFSPEHGLEGKLDEKVGHSIDPASGLKVWSLYGETRRPTDAMLHDIDTLVFDIQDIGTRFYTYIATMTHVMQAAAVRRIRLVVLDRPNPIAPLGAQGPIADADKLAFTAVAPIPVMHGMTIGELAGWINAERGIGCDLRVVKLEGWSRGQWWNQTGLTWVNPSPNMRSPVQAALYPAIGLLEFTNLSVGRGTDLPFERLGAPWIDAPALAGALNELKLPGLRFEPESFTPDSSKFAGQRCGGVRVFITDRAALRPPSSGLMIAATIRRLHGERFEFEPVLKLLANAAAHAAWPRATDGQALSLGWKPELDAFLDSRQRHLLYP